MTMNKKEFLELIQSQDGGLFLICSAKQTNSFSKIDRCDADDWGPAGAVRPSDSRFESIFGSGIVTNVNQLEQYKIVYDFSPHGFLIYIKLRFSSAPGTHDIDSENHLLNAEDPPCAGKNFANFLKLIIEWAKTKDHPWDNSDDPLSDICANFIAASKMPEAIVQNIEENYQDMQVYRFLKGDLNARDQSSVNNEIDEDTLSWFLGLLEEPVI